MRKYKALKSSIITVMFLFFLTGCKLGAKNINISEGMVAIQTLEYDKALVCFEKATLAGENSKLLYRGQGLAYMGKTAYEDAIGSLEKALSYSDGWIETVDYDINYNLAVAYYKTGNTKRAIQIYDAILELKKEEKDAYYLRGVLKAEQGLLEEAKTDFDKTLILDQKNQNRLIEIYCALEENGYKAEGQNYLNAAMENGTKAMTDFEQGRIYYYMEDYENAKNFLEKARESGGYQAVLLLGRTYEILGDFNYAVSVYNVFLNNDKTVPQIYNQLGVCKMQMGEYSEALEAFQTAMKIEDNPILQTLKRNEIAACEYLQEYKKASVFMSNYLKTYPDDLQAIREYNFLESR